MYLGAVSHHGDQQLPQRHLFFYHAPRPRERPSSAARSHMARMLCVSSLLIGSASATGLTSPKPRRFRMLNDEPTFQMVCEDTCKYANDEFKFNVSICDDGGEGSYDWTHPRYDPTRTPTITSASSAQIARTAGRAASTSHPASAAPSSTLRAPASTAAGPQSSSWPTGRASTAQTQIT